MIPDTPRDELLLNTCELMSLGGDDRITLDERSGLNSYGCAPEPMRTLGYSSSTASFIGAAAYGYVNSLHDQIRGEVAVEDRNAADVYEAYLTRAAARIWKVYGLAEGTDLAFGPSGTDLEYIALACALEASAKVCNIVVEVDEVGSGCQHSQAGRYFAPRTALGREVEKGDPLPGFEPDNIRVETVPMRQVDGSVSDPALHAEQIRHAIATSIAHGERPLLHVVHRSKTGIVLPEWDVLNALAGEYGCELDIVVDACQGRISPDCLRRYLEIGATVLVTGSKFIGGPPFSAVAIFPKVIAERMANATSLPAGLAHFFTKAEMPGHWKARKTLDHQANFGMLLRLEAGLFELERLLAHSSDQLERVISAFAAELRALPDDLPFELLESPASGDLEFEPLHPLDRQSLFVIALKPSFLGDRRIDFDDARAIYRMLYRDLSDRFEDPAVKLVARQICHVGQPVRCLRGDQGWHPTYRLSLSAGQISDLVGLDDELLRARFRNDIARIGRKIELAIDLLCADRESVKGEAQVV
ncbi:MAG: hypothetical protein AAF697_01475 [Pseudomonadota bacterium]